MTREPLTQWPDEDARAGVWCRPISATISNRRTPWDEAHQTSDKVVHDGGSKHRARRIEAMRKRANG